MDALEKVITYKFDKKIKSKAIYVQGTDRIGDFFYGYFLVNNVTDHTLSAIGVDGKGIEFDVDEVKRGFVTITVLEVNEQ